MSLFRPLLQRGVPAELIEQLAQASEAAGWSRSLTRDYLKALVAAPQRFHQDPLLGPVARYLAPEAPDRLEERDDLPPWPRFGSFSGMARALALARGLEIAQYGASLPNAQPGRGNPMGSLLVTRGAVIPLASGLDPGCQMRLSVLDARGALARRKHESRALKALFTRRTRFGADKGFGLPQHPRPDHPVLDEDWGRHREVAVRQLGSSGDGNHFVELGVFTGSGPEFPGGRRLAILSHSGSRQVGTRVTVSFFKKARALCKLPREVEDFSWLPQDSELAAQWWIWMDRLVRYATASHEVIHETLAADLGASILLSRHWVHNFASLEGDGRVVHRKGAWHGPPGSLGLLAGTAATPSLLVRCQGWPETLDSYPHGQGRRYSRRAARLRPWSLHEAARQAGVTLMDGSPEEHPDAYRPMPELLEVLGASVEVVGHFQPGFVRMMGRPERPPRPEGKRRKLPWWLDRERLYP